MTHATIDLVKPPGRLISPLSACTNASRLSATPRCPMLWCLVSPFAGELWTRPCLADSGRTLL